MPEEEVGLAGRGTDPDQWPLEHGEHDAHARHGVSGAELAARRLRLPERAIHQMRIAAAASLYFAIVFGAGFVLGPIRVLWLEPLVGPATAALCEAPFLLAAMVVASLWVPGAVRLQRKSMPLILMGMGALVLQQSADVIVGAALRGLSVSDQLAQFATPQGLIYAALLAAFVAMPLLVNGRSA